jgi:putative SOS response-associated peptidase YedK
VRFNPESRERSLDRLRFGLAPRRAKDPAVGTKLFNAPAESIVEKPCFREVFVRRRCLVPATAFYE